MGTIDESRLVTLTGNTTPAAQRAQNDRGPVADNLLFEHLLLVLKPAPETEAQLKGLIDAMHDRKSPEFHHWLTPQQLGERFGLAIQDRETIQRWLESHGFAINRVYQNGLFIDFAGTAAQIRETFHTEVHNLVLPSGEKHVANMSDPQIPAVLAPAIEGVASLHDFAPRSHALQLGPVSYSFATHEWTPHFNVKYMGETFHTVSPYDFNTIYNVLPLWQRGFTGKGVMIALVEDSNLAHESDWSSFRKTFGLTGFTDATFKQVYPNCKNPGQNGDEIEAALDVEWASVAAPDANIELSACGNSHGTFGLDLAILGFSILSRPTSSPTVSGCAKLSPDRPKSGSRIGKRKSPRLLAQLSSSLKETPALTNARPSRAFCHISALTVETIPLSHTRSSVGGTDLWRSITRTCMESRSATTGTRPTIPKPRLPRCPIFRKFPGTLAAQASLSQRSRKRRFHAILRSSGFCNTKLGREFKYSVSGSGGPSTCFTGKPSIRGVVGGTCQGNPKPSWQSGVPGIPNDGLRDQPDLSLFAADGVWGSFLVECMSDKNQGGAPCTANNDALLEGGGGTSFASPAMAGIQALIDQKYGKQGDATTSTMRWRLASSQSREPRPAMPAKSVASCLTLYCIFNDVTAGDMDIPCGQVLEILFYDCYGEREQNYRRAFDIDVGQRTCVSGHSRL